MPQGNHDFISAYLQYIGLDEAPVVFHRWSILTVLGAWIGRDYYFEHGHFVVRPNLYTMLIGVAAARKSTAIKKAVKFLQGAGYRSIAASKTSKEKFMLDLAGVSYTAGEDKPKLTPEQLLESNLWGDDGKDHIPETLVAADEFNVFVGNGNIEFLSLLGVLWDYEGTFENKVKNSTSVDITNPYVNILSGNTPTGFSLAFPAEAIGQGIFSRLLLVHADPTGRRITFPKSPDPQITKELTAWLHLIKDNAICKVGMESGAEKLLDAIYQNQKTVPDVRFESYMGRRFTQLIKLCLIICASRCGKKLSEQDVLYAHTILVHAEHSMPKALGEFGKAKNSDVTHKVLTVLENSAVPVNMKTIWKHVCNDLDDMDKLKDILSNLSLADKILVVKGQFLGKKSVIQGTEAQYVDWSLLTEEERKHVL